MAKILIFQIDLGISIINRGIEEDWASPYRTYNKPVWMNKNVVPCACKQCFFCFKKMIPEMSGSGNKRRSLHDMCSSGSRKEKIIECTHERHTLLTYKAGRYCQQCYDNQPSQLSSTEEKEMQQIYKRMSSM